MLRPLSARFLIRGLTAAVLLLPSPDSSVPPMAAGLHHEARHLSAVSRLNATAGHSRERISYASVDRLPTVERHATGALSSR